MFGMKPVKIPDPNTPSKQIDDYWETSKQQLLSDPRLLDMIWQFDRNNIPETTISMIEPYMKREDFDPVAIKKAFHCLRGAVSVGTGYV